MQSKTGYQDNGGCPEIPAAYSNVMADHGNERIARRLWEEQMPDSEFHMVSNGVGTADLELDPEPTAQSTIL